ncbi:MAG: YHYH protein [Spirulina sp. SIO3F2]|nr:YHYH protein [Spirulina sp. SIO3F2]
MTLLPNSKTLLRSSRWLLPPAALLLLIWGFSSREALTVSRDRSPETTPSHQHDHTLGETKQTHDAEAVHPLDTAADVILLAQNGENTVSIEVVGNQRQITANGIPDHVTGTFPNSGNPNRISAQNHKFTVTTNPQFATTSTPMGLSKFGVALNGVPFEPGAAEFWQPGEEIGGRPQGRPSRPPRDMENVWQYEALAKTPDARQLGLDQNNAHVQPTGSYHYHGLPEGLVNRLGRNSTVLIGYAADGFPIYYSPNARSSYQLKSGTRPTGDDGPGGTYNGTFVRDYEYVAGAGNLDECNGGPVGATAENYGYFITEAFPSIPRCFRGTPDASFQNRPSGGGSGQSSQGRPQGQGRPDGPPPNGRPRPPHDRPRR